ncbi:hypothetical protein SAMN06269185_2878 [Natronoarchaeum philippinense]|uniref:WD40-like Beta Propeller Repeat n=1 Tax=Natronoarchaeum philippinense TaxID=558529 RepID=A0A285P5Q9_NATPI|nr:hypothetical protein [Natronoarchaeum philippinense]SNZ17072.1 hypothetical protein SAMN06269185_2878 [Natronoarchaeum philippinense]
MIDPRTSALFSTVATGGAGIETAILDHSPIRQSSWFDAVVADAVVTGRYLPIETGATDEVSTVAIADLRDDELVELAMELPDGATPTADRETGELLVPTATSVVSVDPADGTGREIGALDAGEGTDRAEAAATRPDCGRIAAGLTRSVDGDSIGLGTIDGETFRVGALDTATGTVESWHDRTWPAARVSYSPTDPSLLLFARTSEQDSDAPAGTALLARKGLGARPLDELLPDRHDGHWWDPDGTGIWYVSPDGVEYLDLELARRELVWSIPAARAHATADGRLVAVTTDGAEPSIRVSDRNTGEHIEVGTGPASADERPVQPQFVGNDEALAYTTEVDGELTLALAPVEAIRSCF